MLVLALRTRDDDDEDGTHDYDACDGESGNGYYGLDGDDDSNGGDDDGEGVDDSEPIQAS